MVLPAITPAPIDWAWQLTNNPLIVSIEFAMAFSMAAILYTYFNEFTSTFILERMKPGWNVLRAAKEKRSKNPGDYTLKLSDKREFVIPEGKEGDHETVFLPKAVRLKKGYRKLWIIEHDQVVHFAKDLVEKAEGLITPSMIPTILNRGSAKRLATAKGIVGGSYTLIILAIGCGVAIGYIIYPQFNHPIGIPECFRVLTNGTRIATSCS